MRSGDVWGGGVLEKIVPEQSKNVKKIKCDSLSYVFSPVTFSVVMISVSKSASLIYFPTCLVLFSPCSFLPHFKLIKNLLLFHFPCRISLLIVLAYPKTTLSLSDALGRTKNSEKLYTYHYGLTQTYIV